MVERTVHVEIERISATRMILTLCRREPLPDDDATNPIRVRCGLPEPVRENPALHATFSIRRLSGNRSTHQSVDFVRLTLGQPWTEFEVQQLLIATRWEFDVPTMLFVIVSMAFIAIGVWRSGRLDVISAPLLQVAYVVVSGFMFIRAYAAIVRARTLGALLTDLTPAFEIANSVLQQATFYLRNGTFLVLFLVTGRKQAFLRSFHPYPHRYCRNSV
ncbi:MAG: hypothetical protein ABI885_05650 [Gammaproteobacteria bacterium]